MARVELLMDWIFDPYAQLKLISCLQKAVLMLEAEYKDMIDLKRSTVGHIESIYSPTHSYLRPFPLCEDVCGRKVSTAFAGDILQVRSL